MKENSIQIRGYIKKLPKDRTIDGILFTEFLLSTCFIYKHGKESRYEHFQVPAIAYRKKYAKKCRNAHDNGKQIRVEGCLSWQPGSARGFYSGFYISADTITIV